jgi:hypothetical protein
MSATFEAAEGGVGILRISGKLSQGELAAVQQDAGAFLRARGRGRLMVVAVAFEGWEQGAAWDDASFQEENDARIEKMAIVGDARWEDLALAFVGKGLRPFPIEYFPHAEIGRARAWLAGPDSGKET